MKTSTDFDVRAFSNDPCSLIVAKPWGYELIFTPTDKPYCGKLLYVKAGYRLSLQYHDQKSETIMLLRGRGLLLSDDSDGELQEVVMEQGKGYSNVPGQRHRLIAIEDCEFIEASTCEKGMTYRLADDTGRAHETEADRLRERLVDQ